MKFCSNQNELLFFVKSAGKIVPQKSTITALEGLYLNIEDDNLNISATNLEAGIKCYLPIEVEEVGSVILPNKFSDIVRLLPEKRLYIEVNDKFNASINCGKSKFLLKGADPQEYPQLPVWEEPEDLKIRVDLLKDLINQTIFSVSHDESKPALMGILFTLEDNTITLTSTDSFRLSISKGTVENKRDDKLQFIVPLKILSELIKYNFSEEYINIKIKDNQILFKIDEFLFFSKLLEENYPQVERIIPEEKTTKAVVSRKEMLESLQRVMLISEGNNFITMLKVKDSSIILKANSEVGSTEEEVQAKVDGEEIEIYLNTSYLIEPLKVIDVDDIIFNFNASNGPCVINFYENPDSFLYLLLPIKS